MWTDHWVGGEVESRRVFHGAWQVDFLHAPAAAAFMAYVEGREVRSDTLLASEDDGNDQNAQGGADPANSDESPLLKLHGLTFATSSDDTQLCAIEGSRGVRVFLVNVGCFFTGLLTVLSVVIYNSNVEGSPLSTALVLFLLGVVVGVVLSAPAMIFQPRESFGGGRIVVTSVQIALIGTVIRAVSWLGSIILTVVWSPLRILRRRS